MSSIRVLVAWDNSNVLYDITNDLQSVQWGLGFREPYQLVANESSATITLNNLDAKYLPEFTLGPLGNRIYPQRRVQIAYYDRGELRDLWNGWIDTIDIKWKPGPNLMPAVLNCVGAKKLLDRRSVSVDLFEDATADEVVTDVLRAAGVFPAGNLWRLGVEGFSELGATTVFGDLDEVMNIETGKTTLAYYGDTDDSNAGDIIAEMTKAERGRFFVDRAGKYQWWNRHHQIKDTVIDDTLNIESGLATAPTAVDYGYGRGVSNVIRVKARPRMQSASETLWELDQTISVSPEDTKKIKIRLRRSNGQFAASGSLLATPTFSSGTATVTVTARGGIAEVAIQNLSTTTNAVLTALEVTGSPNTQQNEYFVEVSDITSIGKFGRRELDIDLGPEADYEDVESTAAYELYRRKDAVSDIRSVSWKRKWDDMANAHMLNWTIGDRLYVKADQLKHAGEYFLIGEKHSWSVDGFHDTTFRFEPADTQNYWVLGISKLGTETILAY